MVVRHDPKSGRLKSSFFSDGGRSSHYGFEAMLLPDDVKHREFVNAAFGFWVFNFGHPLDMNE
jgi:hypothetical protein